MSLFWFDNEVKFNSWSIYLVVKSHVFRARNSFFSKNLAVCLIICFVLMTQSETGRVNVCTWKHGETPDAIFAGLDPELFLFCQFVDVFPPMSVTFNNMLILFFLHLLEILFSVGLHSNVKSSL